MVVTSEGFFTSVLANYHQNGWHFVGYCTRLSKSFASTKLGKLIAATVLHKPGIRCINTRVLYLNEYQVRDYRSLLRHFTLVFCAYTFILWHSLTGGLRRRWANKPLNTFVDALEAFRTAMSFRFVEWLNHNRDVFAFYKASLGFVWAWNLFKSRYL